MPRSLHHLPTLALLALPASACSFTSYAPPSRTMPLETAQAPTAGQTEAQLEVNAAGAVMGFDTTNGGARLRHGITDQLAITGDVGVLHVNGDSPETQREALLGRVGVHVHPARAPRIALTTGFGGGTSPLAGRWLSYDVGVVASAESRHVLPFISGEVFASVPIDPPTFSYESYDGDIHTDRLSNTRGARATAGVALRRSETSRAALLLGLSWGVVANADGDDDQVLGVGAGVRVPLD